MAWNTSTVTLGETTKKTHYDRLRYNDQMIASSTFTFNGNKTWNGTQTLNGAQTINSATLFKKKTTFTATAVFNKERRNSNNDILYNWHHVLNPSTGYMFSITSWAGTDNFTSYGQILDLSSYVTAGTKAVLVIVYQDGNANASYYRKNGDTNISNTPGTSNEKANLLCRGAAVPIFLQSVIYLGDDYKIQVTVDNTGVDLYISYPIAELR